MSTFESEKGRIASQIGIKQAKLAEALEEHDMESAKKINSDLAELRLQLKDLQQRGASKARALAKDKTHVSKKQRDAERVSRQLGAAEYLAGTLRLVIEELEALDLDNEDWVDEAREALDAWSKACNQ